MRDRYWLYVVLGCASAGPAARKRKALGLEGIGGKSIVERLRAISPVVVPDASFLRNPEHRELFLSGLRLAVGEAA